MICLNFRVVGTKFSEGDRLPRLTGCPSSFLCCAVAYFSKHALLLRFHSGCNALIYIEYQWRLHIWNVGQAVFGPLYEGIAFRLCGWHLSISSGPYAQYFAEFNPFFQVYSGVQITCHATLQYCNILHFRPIHVTYGPQLCHFQMTSLLCKLYNCW